MAAGACRMVSHPDGSGSRELDQIWAVAYLHRGSPTFQRSYKLPELHQHSGVNPSLWETSCIQTWHSLCFQPNQRDVEDKVRGLGRHGAAASPFPACHPPNHPSIFTNPRVFQIPLLGEGAGMETLLHRHDLLHLWPLVMKFDPHSVCDFRLCICLTL